MGRLRRDDEDVYYTFKGFQTRCINQGYAFRFDDDFYDRLTLAIGDKTVGEMIRDSITVGKCYFYALLLSRAIKDSTLVHGSLHKLDKEINDHLYQEFKHAWVEKDGYVFDTTARMVFKKEVYYHRMQVEVEKRYEKSDQMENLTFVKLGKYAVSLRPVLKDRFEKICRKWGIDPLDKKIEDDEIDIKNETYKEKSL